MHLHTNALHWEGFPRLLWESLSLFFYTEPPQYDGVEYREEGVPWCRVKMTIPQHPFRSKWQPIEVDVVGYHLIDTIETAALEAIHIFCNQHPMKVAEHPISLFPAIDSSDPEWNFRIAHYNHGTHCRWRGHTSRWRGARHINGYNSCRCSRRVRPNSFLGSPTTFWRLGSGGEAEGLRNRQRKHSTTTSLDNFIR
jgi:hypothetical protein